MNQPDSFPQSPEFSESLEDTLRRHAMEQLESGVYAAWIECVDRYYGGVNSDEQAKLSSFARTELPLVATVRRNHDHRYPGVHSYHLVKAHPETLARVSYGPYGLEPIFVTDADNEGNIVEINPKNHSSTYTEEQVQIVIRQAHELEKYGISMESMSAPGFVR